jgi:hypothetical protein
MMNVLEALRISMRGPPISGRSTGLPASKAGIVGTRSGK